MRPGSFNSGLLKMVEGFVSKMLGELSYHAALFPGNSCCYDGSPGLESY